MNEPNPRESRSDAPNAEDIFLDALDVPPDQRVGWVSDRCDGDQALRERVLALLRADAQAGGDDFLKSAFFAAGPSPAPQPKVQSDSAGSGPGSLDESSIEPGSRSRRFKILASYREGGLGEVLLALDRQLGREVAIKQIKPKWQDHPEARQRFIQEAEVTGRLEHPGIVPVYAMENWPDGRPFYAMRFVQGDTLKEAIAVYHRPDEHETPSVRDLGLRQLLGKFVDVCNTIGYAHSRQILHRDIKPANILVGPYGETLVVDWGLAKVMDAPNHESVTEAVLQEFRQSSGSTPTRFGGTVGTPQYMSPEQADGRLDEIGIRTDIYLLGATLYELLTGVPPHRGETIKAMLSDIVAGKFRLPHELVGDVPPALEAICLKAMAREPIDRYRSVSEIANDIERWLADEPVSVHRDRMPVRIGRWVRRHRTFAYSVAVAATLVTFGSISGSIVWNAVQAKQFRIERENTARANELRASNQRRLLELATAAQGAMDLAGKETAATRYSSALNVLTKAIDELDDESELADVQNELTSRAIRLSRIVDFYEFAQETALYNVLSRDSRGIAACRSSLESLGIWDRPDWWFHLPDQDLLPAQSDRLRWDVYQQWMLMDAMLVKTAGTRLTGIGRITENGGLFGATRRFLRTSAGVSESKSVEVVSRRIEGFRRSEAARWYRRAAEFRLMKGSRLAASDLGLTENAVDSNSLAVLAMIAAIDPKFELFFRNYQGDDSLMTARDLFIRASTQRPDHYWTGLSLAQVEYLLAQRDGGDDIRKFDAALQAIGRCIALDPNNCFAYADRSSIYREQARLVQRLPEAVLVDAAGPASQVRDGRVAELRKWSLADAVTADRLSRGVPGQSHAGQSHAGQSHFGQQQHWVGWQHGLAMHEIGRVDQAIDRFIETSKLTLAMVPSVDASIVRADDLRGRSEAGQIAENLSTRFSDDSRYPALLASIRLNQGRVKAAADAVREALSRSPESAHAHAVAGWLSLQDERPSEAQVATAMQHFSDAERIDPEHDWVDQGIGLCLEHQNELDQSLARYEDAFDAARSSEHRAAAYLGQARVLGAMGRYADASEAITRARVLEPAADLKMSVIRPLAFRYGARQRSRPEDPELPAMKEYLESLVKIPNVSDFVVPSKTDLPIGAAVLNAGFELGTTRYWNEEGGVRVVASEARSGTRAVELSAGVGTSLSQDFPVQAESEYRVEFWAKSGVAATAGIVLSVDQQPLASDFQLSNKWVRIAAKFRTTDVSWPPLTQAQLRFEPSGPAAVLVDDVRVWRIEP